MRARKFPVVADGAGVWSWIHLDDAAAATVLAVEHDGPGVYNIVDDEPFPDRRVAAGAREDPRGQAAPAFPRLLARLFAGEAPVVMATESRGASNAKAKRELGWKLRYPSWREGSVPPMRQPRRRSDARPIRPRGR